MILLNKSELIKLFDAAAAAISNSAERALPDLATQIQWTTLFGTAPASCTIQIQTSLDGTNWTTADSSTSVTGETRVFNSSALFVLARINAITGGAEVTVQLISKPVYFAFPFNQSLDTSDSPTLVGLTLTDMLILGSYLQGTEIVAPAAPAANGFRIFAEDNGSGKTRLMVLFASGAAQQIAIQP